MTRPNSIPQELMTQLVNFWRLTSQMSPPHVFVLMTGNRLAVGTTLVHVDKREYERLLGSKNSSVAGYLVS